jgi:hypothetical protein
VPVLLGVMVAEQLDVVLFTLASVQGVPLNDPAAVPVLLNDTVPPGVDAVPDAVSLTNAVHVTVRPTGTLMGEQDTLVVVARVPPTLTVLLAALLVEWTLSLGV